MAPIYIGVLRMFILMKEFSNREKDSNSKLVFSLPFKIKLMSFKVTEVIDGDTFKVSPNWEWKGQSGDLVRPNGYNTPEKGEQGFDQATSKLRNLIEGEEVELKNAITFTYGRLLCDVYFNEKNIKDSFSEYQ